MPKITIIESPYAGNIDRNLSYARRAMTDSLKSGETPFASHLLYPQVLDDTDPEERTQGIFLGYQFMALADLVAFYTDLGWSRGMNAALNHALTLNVPTVFRTLEED